MPSSRIRVSDLVPELAAHGVSSTVEVLPSGFRQRCMLFKRAKEFSVTVLQKKLLRWMDFKMLRYYANRLVFDFDDAIYLRCASPSSNPRDYDSRTRKQLFRRTVRHSDLVIAANRVLAEEVSRQAPQTDLAIIPSSINVDGITPKTDYALNSRPVIGWIGSTSTLRYLSEVKEALKVLQEKHNSILHVIADKPFEAEGVDTQFIPWELESQYDATCQFDIGIMPLTADPFSKGKASFKLLQYLACALPAVCSPVGMNIDVSDGERNCLMADDSEHFFSQLDRLIEDQPLRESLGNNGRRLILEHYTSQAVAKSLAAVLSRVREGN